MDHERKHHRQAQQDSQLARERHRQKAGERAGAGSEGIRHGRRWEAAWRPHGADCPRQKVAGAILDFNFLQPGLAQQARQYPRSRQDVVMQSGSRGDGWR